MISENFKKLTQASSKAPLIVRLDEIAAMFEGENITHLYLKGTDTPFAVIESPREILGLEV